MQPFELKKIVEEMTYKDAVNYIHGLPLELSLIRDMTHERLWRVENYKDISYISLSHKSLVTGMAQMGIILHS